METAHVATTGNHHVDRVCLLVDHSRRRSLRRLLRHSEKPILADGTYSLRADGSDSISSAHDPRAV